MIVGKYRITKRGYVVFGSFGIILLLVMGFWLKGLMTETGQPVPNADNAGQSEGTQTGDGTQANSGTQASNGTQANSGTQAGNGTQANPNSPPTGTADGDSGLSLEEKNKILAGSTGVIYFKPDDYELDAAYYPLLDELVQVSLRFKDARIHIDGHYNGYPDFKATEIWISLAQNRAEMVEAYFISQGLSQDRITINNLGCSVPVNKDDSWQELEKNRRVEIRFEPLTK